MWYYQGILDITEMQIMVVTILQLLSWSFSLEEKKFPSPFLTPYFHLHRFADVKKKEKQQLKALVIVLWKGQYFYKSPLKQYLIS